MAQSAELHLWRAVLFVGLRAKDAAKWVGTADFRQVASLAGLEPDAVRAAWLAESCPLTRSRGTDRRGLQPWDTDYALTTPQQPRRGRSQYMLDRQMRKHPGRSSAFTDRAIPAACPVTNS